MNKNNHFVDYWLEERGETAIVTEKGFITYKIHDEFKEILVNDFYVDPKYRGTLAAKEFGDMVAEVGRKNGCKTMTCYIQHQQGEEQKIRTTKKLKTFITFGFILHSMNESQILLYKNI